MSMIVDRRALDFILFEVLDAGRLLQHPHYATYDRAAVGQVLDAAQKIAEDKFATVAAELDADEPAFVNGTVVMPAGAGQALRACAEAGFFSLPFATEAGGLQAPWFLHTAVMGMFNCAEAGLANYLFLTVAAANLIKAFGSEALKQAFLPPMLDGRWFGTMCLSETQAGSSLGDIATAAMPRPDGLYAIKGSKMWISAGEHAMSENIVHMVLAKIPGGPPGTKGISLFLVPKYRLSADGTAGAPNNIALAGLNHKMGQRSTTNCLLNFGEGGECLGYLIGEPHRGMECMFRMMNEARIAVGHAAAMIGLAGYLYSADYARTRAQGRSAGDKDPGSPQVAIVQHADVKRMLLAQKAAVEGAQALCLYCATLVDELAISEDAERRKELSALLGLLTPVAKSWPSEHCLEANKWAIQILGGYGYTRDFPVERHYRDNRLNHIHEGTFGIQGIDLVGRKVLADGAATLFRFVAEMRETVSATPAFTGLDEHARAVSASLDALTQATKALLGATNQAQRLANATIYLDAFGHVVIGWLWLRQAIVAANVLAAGAASEPDRAFYDGKLAACRYFARYELPLADARLALCESLDSTCLDAPVETFGGQG
ncbi:MAG TPA: acyl-CoA dehydrogenase [Bauldia sp.]|nr:acyl-CoA dehydrogenase [Bauldia sp.]